MGAIGLTLPAALDFAPGLTPIAATGLAITMALAIVVHVRRREHPIIGINVILLAAATFVSWGRFGPHAF